MNEPTAQAPQVATAKRVETRVAAPTAQRTSIGQAIGSIIGMALIGGVLIGIWKIGSMLFYMASSISISFPSGHDLSVFVSSIWDNVNQFFSGLPWPDKDSPGGLILYKIIPDFLKWAGATALAGSAFLFRGLSRARNATALIKSEKTIIEKDLREKSASIIDAPYRIVRDLDELIDRAIKEGEEMAVVNARAIVSARDAIIESVALIGKGLNSDIDTLAKKSSEKALISRLESSLQPGRLAPKEEIYNTIMVLSRAWPAKRTSIVLAVRQLFQMAGLDTDFKPRSDITFK